MMPAGPPRQPVPVPQAVADSPDSVRCGWLWANQLGGLTVERWRARPLAAYGDEADRDRTRYYRLLWDLGP